MYVWNFCAYMLIHSVCERFVCAFFEHTRDLDSKLWRELWLWVIYMNWDLVFNFIFFFSSLLSHLAVRSMLIAHWRYINDICLQAWCLNVSCVCILHEMANTTCVAYESFFFLSIFKCRRHYISMCKREFRTRFSTEREPKKSCSPCHLDRVL